MSAAPWPPAPLNPPLAEGRVELLLASLDVDPARMAGLSGALSEEERKRAGLFKLERDRDRFRAARGVLRLMLSRYLGARPEDIKLSRGERGKPRLADDSSGGLDIRFSLSRSDDAALYAFALGREVGVDLERVRPYQGAEAIVREFFSPREAARLESLPEPERTETFFSYWTAKEACLKALGVGLGGELKEMTVVEGEGGALSLERGRDELELYLVGLRPTPEHAAALAVLGAGCEICRWSWPDEAPL